MSDQPTTINIDGMTVTVYIERTEDGPLLILGGNVRLEGVAPGEYLVSPFEDHAAAS